MDNVPTPPPDAAKLRKLNDEIYEREQALLDLQQYNFSELHEDQPAAQWVKYVPIGNALLLVALIIIQFVKK